MRHGNTRLDFPFKQACLWTPQAVSSFPFLVWDKQRQRTRILSLGLTVEAGQRSSRRPLNRNFLLQSRPASQLGATGFAAGWLQPPLAEVIDCHTQMMAEDHRSLFCSNKEGHLLCFQITQANICSSLLGKFLPCLLGVQISPAALGEQPLLPPWRS